MDRVLPHFLLFSETSSSSQPNGNAGQWRFVLEEVDGDQSLEASDREADLSGERLELLAVVRGLEALDQPSRVTLITPSRYVSRAFVWGLAQWRDNGWLWERFGAMTPIKHADLWQRVDVALRYHQVECRTWRFDRAHRNSSDGHRLRGPHYQSKRKETTAGPCSSAADE